MQIKVSKPNNIKGCIVLPSSKSISNRVLVINALAADRSTTPDNLSDCDDTKVMTKWLADRQNDIIDIGAAGTAMRFSTALLAVSDGERTITGTERMCNRPVKILVDALRSLGAEIDYEGKEGFPPLRIKGNSRLAGGKVSIPGTVSSQYISALLMIAPVLDNGLEIALTDGIISRPYINLTMELMKVFGAVVKWTDDTTIKVEPKPYTPRKYYVESDWSASSYWYEIVALSDSAEVILPSLSRNSLQGDSKVAEIFRKLGVSTEFIIDEETGRDCVRLSKTSCDCKHLDLDFIDQPDLAQTVVVCCCMMGVHFRFTGLQSLRIKETDRIAALQRELAKLGFAISVEDDNTLCWHGETSTPDDVVAIDTYEDHRMAMAFAPCCLKHGSIVINNPEVVSKSYPNFWNDLKSVGFAIE